MGYYFKNLNYIYVCNGSCLLTDQTTCPSSKLSSSSSAGGGVHPEGARRAARGVLLHGVHVPEGGRRPGRLCLHNPSGRREARLHSGQRGGRGPRRASASVDRHVFRMRSGRGCRCGVPAGGCPRVVVGPARCGASLRVLVRPWNRAHSLGSPGRAHSHSCEIDWELSVHHELFYFHLCY